MNCRKRMVGVGTGGGGHPGMSLGGDLETGLGGTRLEGGVTLDVNGGGILERLAE